MEIIHHQFNPRMHRNHMRATLLSRYSALYRDTQQTPLRPESGLSIFAYRSASELHLTEFIRTASLFHLHPHCSVQEKKKQSQTPILLISTSLTLPNINRFNKNPLICCIWQFISYRSWMKPLCDKIQPSFTI